MPRRREVDDRESAEADRDAGIGVDPVTGIVRSAMDERVAHPPDVAEKVSFRSGSDESSHSAHSAESNTRDMAPTTERDGELALRARGAGIGALATLGGRGFDVLATYVFYAIAARSMTVSDFGRFVLAFAILQAAAAAALLGLDQALLAAESNGATNRFGLEAVTAASIALATAALLFVRLLPPFAPWIIATFPCVVVGQFLAGAMRASRRVSAAAAADSIVQPAIAAAGALIAAAYAPSASSFAIAFLVSWLAMLFFAPLVPWRGGNVDRFALLRTGRSMLGVSMLHQATASADIFILGAIATAAGVAHYGVAQKIATAFILLHGAITTASTPFMRGLTTDRPLLARYYHVVRRWTILAALPLLVVCVAAPHFLLGLFGPKYAEASVAPLVLLSFAGFILVASGPAGSTLLCTGHARELFRVTAAGTIALVACVALLSPFGVIGIAAGVLAGRVIGRGLLLLAMRRYAEIPLV